MSEPAGQTAPMNLLLRANAPIHGFPHRCHRNRPVNALPDRDLQIAVAEGWLLLGNADEAQRELEKLSYQDRHYPEALRVGVRIALALRLPEEALDRAAKLAGREPQNPGSWHLLLQVALDGCGRTDWALRILREAVIHLPENPELRMSLELVTALAGPGL